MTASCHCHNFPWFPKSLRILICVPIFPFLSFPCYGCNDQGWPIKLWFTSDISHCHVFIHVSGNWNSSSCSPGAHTGYCAQCKSLWCCWRFVLGVTGFFLSYKAPCWNRGVHRFCPLFNTYGRASMKEIILPQWLRPSMNWGKCQKTLMSNMVTTSLFSSGYGVMNCGYALLLQQSFHIP